MPTFLGIFKLFGDSDMIFAKNDRPEKVFVSLFLSFFNKIRPGSYSWLESRIMLEFLKCPDFLLLELLF